MHVVLDIGIAIAVLCAISFGGLGAFIVYANRKRNGAHRLPEQQEENKMMAWVVGLRDDTDVFFAGSEIPHP